MAHAVENMFYVGETPWHGLGNPLIEAPTIEEGIVIAGLDWEVKTEPLFTKGGIVVDSRATYREIKGVKDGKQFTKHDVLGVVGPRYTPLQNKDAFAWFQPFIDSGEASLHTAGSLHDGKTVWVLAVVNGDPLKIRGNDDVIRFILLSNSHDGSTSVRVGFTPIRVVCANTLAFAHADEASTLIRLRHSTSVKANLEAVRDVMSLANAEFEATAEQYRMLAKKDINKRDLKRYIKKVLGYDQKDVKEMSKRGITMMNKRIGTLLDRFEDGRGIEVVPEVAGTWWAAYNAVTEYLSYDRGRSKDENVAQQNRLDSVWFGPSANDNVAALHTALEMAA